MENMAAPFDFNNLAQGADPSVMSNHSGQHANDHDDHHADDVDGDVEGDGVPPNATVYQTTGPNAYTKAIEGNDGSPMLNPRSCVTCRRRKVRCDKQQPCTTCRRALIPCIFPAPGRKPRQPRPRDPNAPPKNFSKREVELVKRLKKLEGIVEELSGQIEVDGSKASSPDVAQNHTMMTPPLSNARTPHNTVSRPYGPLSGDQSGSPTGPSPKDADSVSDTSEAARRREVRQQFGRLVLNDHKGRTRYVSSAFWSKMNDELDALRRDAQLITDDESEESDFEETPEQSPIHNEVTHDHHAFLLGYSSADVDLRKLYPVPSHIWFLWKVYQDGVEPLIKIVHVPTADQLLREATKNLNTLSAGDQALVFSILFAAVVALDPADAETNFNTTKAVLIAQYRFAVEQALAKADLLTTADFAVIQALVIFLVVARRYDTSRFCWAMTGLLIRLAQGMGLHRDGSYFDLTPYETEMRRRVWWSILMIELRSSEELGTDFSLHERGFDTEMPLNINDADMSPEGTEPLVPREGRTDMSVHVIRCEITKMSRHIATAASAQGTMCPVNGGNTFEDLERMLLETYNGRMQEQITKISRGSEGKFDSAFWLAGVIVSLVMSKLYMIIYQPVLFSDRESLAPDVRQRLYVCAVEMLENDNNLHVDPRAQPFRWLSMTYSLWQPVAYALVESARRSWGPLTERGWEAICSFNRLPLGKTKKADQSAVFLPLRKLFISVQKHRATELARLKQHPEEARRIEAEERNNETQAWFGTSGGRVDPTDRVRAKWWALVNSDDNANMAPSFDNAQQQGVFSNGQMVGMGQPMPNNIQTKSASQQPGVSQISPSQMQFMNHFMTQQELNLTDLYDLHNNAAVSQQLSQIAQDDTPGMGFPISNPNLSSANFAMFQNLQPQQQSHQQQQQQQQQQSMQQTMQTNDPLPPFMWGNWLDADSNGSIGGVSSGLATAEQGKNDAGLSEDLNMLDGDFDWQDWNQTLKGLEMWQGGEAPGAR